MSHEFNYCSSHDLVVALVGPAKLQDHAPDQQVADLWQLRVDDRYEGREDVREPRRRHLRADHRPYKHAAPANEVLLKQLLHQILDVGHVHLVHQAVDALPQRLPGLPLELGAGLVLYVLLQARHLEWRNVHAAAAPEGLDLRDLALLVRLEVLVLALDLLFRLAAPSSPRLLLGRARGLLFLGALSLGGSPAASPHCFGLLLLATAAARRARGGGALFLFLFLLRPHPCEEPRRRQGAPQEATAPPGPGGGGA
mmetsp:Transcript_11520/g.32119  ORF Transcript_11520/g.32119 Transcript_11520/m.32119 type:complete len:254 (-) Transcript_11520:14-775(-)